MIKTLFLVYVLALSLHVEAKPKVYDPIPVKNIRSVYDGDTFRVDLDCNVQILCENISVRVSGIDTPEMKDKRPRIKKKAVKAKVYVKQKLHQAGRIELKNIRRGKYFRIVADVYIDGENLADQMIVEGLAKPYDGGKKIEWK